jgi:hypothetical protein
VNATPIGDGAIGVILAVVAIAIVEAGISPEGDRCQLG